MALTAPFTPSNSLVAAALFTPRVSGILQVSGTLLVQNGGNADNYAMIMSVNSGTGLSVSGGESTSDGWVMGSATPPVVGGSTTGVVTFEGFTSLAASAFGDLSVFGVMPPDLAQPIGVPLLIGMLLTEVGSGHALATLAVGNLVVMELP